MIVKPWVKAAGWLVLGGGVGFFAGYQIGAWTSSKGPKNANKGHSYVDGTAERDNHDKYLKDFDDAARQVMAEYGGQEPIGDIDGDELLADPNLAEKLAITDTDVETVPDDIPQLHPQHLVPVPISEKEWNENRDDLDKVDLIFYEYDEVLYCPDTQDIIVDADAMLGFGATFRFYGDPNNPTDVIYIQNETMGAMYRIRLEHAAYSDEPPAEEDGEEKYDHTEEYEDEYEDSEDDSDEEVYYGD